MRRPLLLAAVAASLAVASVALADGNKEQIHRTAADDANARVAVLTRADLGTAVVWKGGAKKPDVGGSSACPKLGYNPQQTDLVLTGAAESEFSNSGLDFDSEAQVLQTADMVKLDWQRSITPKLLPCLRATFEKSLTGVTFVSATKLGFPHVSTYTAAFRVAFDVKSKGTTTPWRIDVVLYGRGRTELNLGVTYPAGAAKAVFPAEVRIAKLMVLRIRA